ncbi:MAG: threonylcarbamoyl-AMP synthase [Rhodobacteraceae bacterium]|nr:threonylcarbamoyl-AMP synthase [Paracoccaceae bacterium]
MSKDQTRIFGTSAPDLQAAAQELRAGHLIAFPTETVYGLGGDATNPTAVAGIYAAKGRPSFNPLIVHVGDADQAAQFAEFNSVARTLANAFWPGPMTLVLPLRPNHGLASLVTAGLPTVAVRVPAHPVARGLLGAFGGPVAAPSANPSGKISPTRAAHVIDGLSGRIAGVVDGGECKVGLESTIIAPDTPPRLLRPGGLAAEEIEAALGTALASAEGGKITAPGQMTSHYAPEQAVRLNVTQADPHAFTIGFGDICGDVSLSETGDLHEAAARLFDVLHLANASGQPIAVAPIPFHGLGVAINDRLARAAAPRD